jgi:hypothetical protein
MRHSERTSRSFTTTAIDAVLAFSGIVAVVFPITALADAVLGSPLGARVLVVSALAGVIGAVPYASFDWSLGRLARFVGATLATSFGWLVVVGAVLSLLGVPVPAGDRRPFLYAGLLAIATGYTVVYSDAVDATFESRDASSFENWS